MACALVPAAYVYLLRNEQVLLQRRHNTGYMDEHWVAGAAGHIELWETAAECAIREAREELGILLASADLQPLTIMMRTDRSDNPREQRADWFFMARHWQGTPERQELDKCDSVQWHALASLPDPMPSYERHVLERFRDGTLAMFTYDGFDRS